MQPNRRSFVLSTVGLGARLRAGSEGVDDPAGRFWRCWWFEMGAEHGNPGFNRRFRVNSPETSLHPTFGSRSEARSSGMLQIFMPEDPRQLDAVELYLELWGGHPGTANRRVTVNGRSQHPIPENGTAAGHCTHLYPTIRLRREDVVNGYNAVQFACDQGSTFWGHFIVDNACLRAGLPPTHPDLAKLGLDRFRAQVRVQAGPGEAFTLELESNQPDRILQADFRGFYEGYDENGDGITRDWHGFTKHRRPEAWLGGSSAPPFRVPWDTSMLPEAAAGVRARLTFRDAPGLIYETAPVTGLSLPSKGASRVSCIAATSLPVPFWSRAGKPKSAKIELPFAPRTIQRAQLHVVVWDGGRGTVQHPFRLNGQPLEVCGKGAHDVIYSVHEVAPKLLERDNLIEVLSDTDHHGIEILLPGPALIARTAG
jgi:hypothetical protein